MSVKVRNGKLESQAARGGRHGMGRSAADRAAPAGAHRAAPASAGGAVAAGARDSRTDAHRDSVLVFAALGDKTRLDLVTRLCAGGPLSITRLSAGTEVTRQAITKHLNTLAEAGLVRDIWAGRERLWEVQPGRLEEARRCLERISGQWDEALARLKGAVEREEH